MLDCGSEKQDFIFTVVRLNPSRPDAAISCGRFKMHQI